jgi:ABC-type Fe3+-siderophore transport system permease subunit
MNRLSGTKILVVSLAMLAAWFIVVIFSLNIGSVPIPIRTSFRLLADRLTGGSSSGDPLETVLFSVRLPRVLLGSLVGAALAAAGTAFQSLLRNPLADPYVLGVSTGASMGTILYSIFAGWLGFASAAGGIIYGRPLAAFLGAVFTVGAVYIIAGGHCLPASSWHPSFHPSTYFFSQAPIRRIYAGYFTGLSGILAARWTPRSTPSRFWFCLDFFCYISFPTA